MTILSSIIPFGVMITGLLGSVHCAGMCGPLLLAATTSANQRYLYNLGRLLGYFFLGLLMGSVGNALESSLPTLQIVVAFIIGGTLIGVGLHHLFFQNTTPWIKQKWSNGTLKLLTTFSKLNPPFPWIKSLLIGFGSAFLPCGFLYSVVLTAILTQNALKGALVLTSFWVGTLPIMTFFPNIIQKKLAPFVRIPKPLISGIFMIFGLGILWVKIHAIKHGTCCH